MSLIAPRLFFSQTPPDLYVIGGPCVCACSLFRLVGFQFADTMRCISDRREKTIAQKQVGIHMTKKRQTHWQGKDQKMAPQVWLVGTLYSTRVY